MGSLKRPVRFVFRAHGNPLAQGLLFRRGEMFLGLGGRHEVIRIRCKDSGDQGAFIRCTRCDRGHAVDSILESMLGGIEAEFTLARFGVGAVALEAVFRENRPHIAREIGFGVAVRCGGESRREDYGGDGGSQESDDKRGMRHVVDTSRLNGFENGEIPKSVDDRVTVGLWIFGIAGMACALKSTFESLFGVV